MTEFCRVKEKMRPYLVSDFLRYLQKRSHAVGGTQWRNRRCGWVIPYGFEDEKSYQPQLPSSQPKSESLPADNAAGLFDWVPGVAKLIDRGTLEKECRSQASRVHFAWQHVESVFSAFFIWMYQSIPLFLSE